MIDLKVGVGPVLGRATYDIPLRGMTLHGHQLFWCSHHEKTVITVVVWVIWGGLLLVRLRNPSPGTLGLAKMPGKKTKNIMLYHLGYPSSLSSHLATMVVKSHQIRARYEQSQRFSRVCCFILLNHQIRTSEWFSRIVFSEILRDSAENHGITGKSLEFHGILRLISRFWSPVDRWPTLIETSRRPCTACLASASRWPDIVARPL